MMRSAVVVVALAGLAACGRSSAPIAPGPETASESEGSPGGPPARGELRMTGRGLRFTVCGAADPVGFPLSGKSNEIEDVWRAFEVPDDRGMYLELRGALEVGGASFRVDELVRARPFGEGPSCAVPVFDGDFIINGNEPFWGIEIRREGIVYRTPEAPGGRTYPYAATRTEAGKLLYATRSDQPAVSTLEIDLTPQRCVDSMSGEIRSHVARVALDGLELRGCAVAGVPFGEFGDDPLDELERYAGTYEALGSLFASEPLKTRLAALLGPKLQAFRTRFEVAGPLRRDQGVYFVTGNRRHQGGVDIAAFLADPETGTINVVLVEDRKRQDYKEGGRDIALPDEVATLLANVRQP